MKKTVLLFLSAVLLFSCAPVSKTPAPSRELPFFSGEEGELGLVVDGVCRYTVIRSENASEEIVAAARSLDTYLFHHLETHIDVKNDFAKERPLEILVGATDRPESQRALEDLEENEFILSVEGKKILLCGGSDVATVKAVERFLKTCVKNRDLKEDEVPQLILRAEEFVFRGEVL